MSMNKKYKLEEIGGMNSEVLIKEMFFDNMDEVFDYCNREEICDDNGVRFRNSYDEEGWIEWGEYKDYVVNEGLMLVELGE